MLLFVPLSFEETTLFRDKRVPTVKGKERPSPHELNPLSNRSWRMFSVEPPALGAFSSADNASRSDIEPYGRRHTEEPPLGPLDSVLVLGQIARANIDGARIAA